MPRFLITTLAESQTEFWREVGLRLQALGHRAAFLSFDDRSSEMLQQAGLKVYSATQPVATPSDAEFDRLMQQFGLSELNYWFGHERFAFNVTDSGALRRKLVGCLQAADAACLDWSRDGPVTMIQELGGFLSVVGSYFAARRNGIDNWFLEPSFFRGRLFFLRNRFSALRVDGDGPIPVPDEVKQYLQRTIEQGAIVIPQKDRHQYTTAWKKIVNRRNFARLAAKLADKHLHGKKQEFGHISSHVRTHARMLWSSSRLRGSYTPLADAGRFVYYPLHVPGDMALTLRTPHLLDQLSLIDYLCRAVPHGFRVAVKEHPAMVGAVDSVRLRALLSRYDNLLLLPPSTNNYEVLARTQAVVSINSKTGAEAALLGKPVVVLGDAFYRGSPLVTALPRLEDLPQALAGQLAADRRASTPDEVGSYFAAVWARSLPGELYVSDAENVMRFTDSLLCSVKQGAA